MQNVITIHGLTLEFSKVRSTFDSDGLPVWSGKVTLVFRDRIAGTTTKLTANFSVDTLADFEGEPEGGDPIYKFCEDHASTWAGEILDALAPIKAPTFAGYLPRVAA